MAHIRLALVTVAILFLAGCPYNADHPLSDPSASPLDPALVGTWQSEDPETHEVTTITILPFNDHELAGFSRESGSADAAITAFRLLATTIGGERFLSILELSDDQDQQWYFARYRVTAGTLSLRLVDDALFESRSFAGADELRGFLHDNAADDRLYGGPETEAPPMVLRRVP